MKVFREFTITKVAAGGEGFDNRTVITFEDDGSGYRRIESQTSDDYIDVPITGDALEYERRVLEAKQQMYEADNLTRKHGTAP